MIYTFIPFDPTGGKNLGNAYNKCMELLPNDNDYACFIDLDAMFTTNNWYNQLTEVIKNNPNIHVFTAITNRLPNKIPNKFQTTGDNKTHDMKYHRRLGWNIAAKFGAQVVEYQKDLLMSGVVLMVKKSVWKKIKFNSGLYGVDIEFHKACVKSGVKVGLMKGVYVYHWCRAPL